MLRLWQTGEHRKAVEMLILCIMRSSPGADEARIRNGLCFNGNGTLRWWDLRLCGLTALPEEFGMVRTTGKLDLSSNQLASLPESFGALTVGRNLELHHNRLTCLPENFGAVTVGWDLLLEAKPASFYSCGGHEDIGPAFAEAIELHFPNVGGLVRK
eukprot:TRINITY_DN2091_c0_g2_i1.p2 TRINITY_DN2091_c0_g2~~TRINITY_DN2091_c0_g2_i1.p2  ORF type:complete len:157 (-),score=29.46 TRINITY_DN2091_c0_g2_i1:88-558(-)